MTDRQKLILLSVVKEYIKYGQPIGSKLIFEKYSFNISPATFRNEFAELEDEGYLFQPHTSSGRVPTDKGYRFFVNYLMEKRNAEKERMVDIFSEFVKAKRRQDEIFAELTRALSGFSKNVVLSGPLGSRLFFRSGINEVFSQPEFNDLALRSDFGSLIDSFEENVTSVIDKLKRDDFVVLIGKENPFNKAKEFSMILSRCNLSGEEGIVAILGPKRMDYAKNIDLINSLRHLLN